MHLCCPQGVCELQAPQIQRQSSMCAPVCMHAIQGVDIVAACHQAVPRLLAMLTSPSASSRQAAAVTLCNLACHGGDTQDAIADMGAWMGWPADVTSLTAQLLRAGVCILRSRRMSTSTQQTYKHEQ